MLPWVKNGVIAPFLGSRQPGRTRSSDRFLVDIFCWEKQGAKAVCFGVPSEGLDEQSPKKRLWDPFYLLNMDM